MNEWTDVSDRKQEEAYFHKLNQELVEKQEQSHPVSNDKVTTEPSAQPGKSDFYDFLDRHLQPKENWLADI